MKVFEKLENMFVAVKINSNEVLWGCSWSGTSPGGSRDVHSSCLKTPALPADLPWWAVIERQQQLWLQSRVGTDGQTEVLATVLWVPGWKQGLRVAKNMGRMKKGW